MEVQIGAGYLKRRKECLCSAPKTGASIDTYFQRAHSLRVKAMLQQSPKESRECAMTPNPSIERTSTGRAHLAFISFWAKRALPVPAAHVKR